MKIMKGFPSLKPQAFRRHRWTQMELGSRTRRGSRFHESRFHESRFHESRFHRDRDRNHGLGVRGRGLQRRMHAELGVTRANVPVPVSSQLPRFENLLESCA